MINGVLNIYKEKGYTSHDVVAKMRGILKQKKIGHTGTLDPDAEGVLPVCLGKATKLCDMLTDETKTYRAGILLGKVTDTQDMTGEILTEDTEGADAITPLMFETCVHTFQGEQMQVPPMYSAKKVGGKKLYELARQGKVIERQAVPVTFHEIKTVELNLPHAVLEVTCSKGTYIRTLCHDIGQKLGCGACMESLLRTRVGRFSLEDSVKLKQLQEYGEQELEQHLVSIETMFDQLPAYVGTPEQDKALYNGNAITPVWQTEDQIDDNRLEESRSEDIPLDKVQLEKHQKEKQKDIIEIRVYTSKQEFIGIYEYDQKHDWYKPKKMFYEAKECQ